MEIDKLIGNTPMIKIKIKYGEKIINVYAKLEIGRASCRERVFITV